MKNIFAVLFLLALCAPASPALAYQPNDPYYSYQWHMGQIRVAPAWDYNQRGRSDVKVAVVDTGVAYENYMGFSQVSDLAQTNFDTINAYNFVGGSRHPNDDNGHGTHVTGTVAQSTDNLVGVTGVAPGVTIIPIKVFNSDGEASADLVAQAINHAINAGADIINFSAGGNASTALEQACRRAYEAGILVVAASGNSDSATLDYPAAYPFVLAVGAIRLDLTRSYYSNYSADMVMAPGGDVQVDQNNDGYGDGVLQQTNDGGYWFYQGTSMAAPHVSGLAALILSEAMDINLSIPLGSARVDWLMNIIKSNTMDLGLPGQDSEFGYGLVMAEHALAGLNGVSCRKPPLGCGD